MDPKNFKCDRNKIEKIQARRLLSLLIDYSSNSSELLQRSESVSTETRRSRTRTYEAFKTLIDLNPNFMKDILLLSKCNSQKRQSSCLFSKYNKVWKQKDKVTWDTHVKPIARRY